MKPVRKNIFKGNIISVFTGEKRLPNGKKAYFEEVDHPGAALVVPFIKGKVIFIRQYRGVIGKYLWELPAGKLDPDEEPFTCAKREIKEETGYSVKNLKKIGLIYTTPGFCNEKIVIFKAECETKEKPKTEPDELITVIELNKRQIKRLFNEGKITDAKTIAALSFAGIL